MQNFMFEVFIFLAAACVVVPLSNKLNLGSVLGYLLAGVIIGPYALKIINNAEEVMHFAEFGVVMMLFIIGLELEPHVLWRMRKSIIGLGGLQVVLTSAVFAFIGFNLGFGWQASIAAGLALSLSSTAIVLQILNEKKLMNTILGETSFSVLLFQDIAVIPILVLMPFLAIESTTVLATHTTNISHLPSYMQALIIAAVIAGVVVTGRYFSNYLFRYIANTKQRELFTAFSLALVVGITILMHLVGISPALGAFLAGVVLANSEYRHTLESDIQPFKGLLLGLFFISVGMGIDFQLLMSSPISVLGAVVGVMLVKASILFGLGHIFKLPPIQNIGYAFMLCQGGEFAFVLFQLAGGLAVLNNDIVIFLTLVVALSMALTPLLILFYNRFLVPKFMSVLPEREYDKIDEINPIILVGFGRFGQVIGRFLMGQGIKVTVLENDPDQIALIRKFGFKSYYGDATRADLLHTAGATKAKLIIIAVDEAEHCLNFVKIVKHDFPNLTIFARARNRQHAYDLHNLGVEYFKREMFDSSLNMARDIMVWLGKNPADMQKKAEKFRKHDDVTLKESFKFFEDEPALMDYAKMRRDELEQILKSDTENS